MPFFKPDPEPDTWANRQAVASPQSRIGSMFSSNQRSLSPDDAVTRSTSNRQGFFGRSHSPVSSSSDSSSIGRKDNTSWTTGGSFFGRGSGDSTISAARQKVADAEAAEKRADRALLQARAMVKEAREHVKILEREAAEE